MDKKRRNGQVDDDTIHNLYFADDQVVIAVDQDGLRYM